jgi:hypothetical protein
MASPAKAAKPAPSPAEIDLKAIEYKKLEKNLQDSRDAVPIAAKPVASLKAELIDLVDDFGGPHSEKSKILHGIAWELMATFSQGMSQDSAAIDRLREALKKAKKVRLLKKLFQQDIRWTFKAASVEMVKREKLSPALMQKLLLCFVPVDRTPTLDVREKKKPPSNDR